MSQMTIVIEVFKEVYKEVYKDVYKVYKVLNFLNISLKFLSK